MYTAIVVDSLALQSHFSNNFYFIFLICWRCRCCSDWIGCRWLHTRAYLATETLICLLMWQTYIRMARQTHTHTYILTLPIEQQQQIHFLFLFSSVHSAPISISFYVIFLCSFEMRFIIYMYDFVWDSLSLSIPPFHMYSVISLEDFVQI